MNESERRQLHASKLDQAHEDRAAYMPTPEQIAAECAKIRAEKRSTVPPVDPDCDADLELEADYESRRRRKRSREPNVFRIHLEGFQE